MRMARHRGARRLQASVRDDQNHGNSATTWCRMPFLWPASRALEAEGQEGSDDERLSEVEVEAQT